MSNNSIFSFLLFGVIFLPFFAFCILSIYSLFSTKTSERLIAHISRSSFIVSIGLLLLYFYGQIFLNVEVPKLNVSWFKFENHHFEATFATDNLTLFFLTLTTTIGTLVSVFSETYLHKEKGYLRFYLLILLATYGMNLIVSANNLGIMVIGWEFLGIASTLLISFYYERQSPLKNAFKAFIAYRIADFGFLFAILYGHHAFQSADVSVIFHTIQGVVLSPEISSSIFIFGSFLLFAALGKSSLLPFYPWLPRAMEGPTPSSALFYGGFTIHAGTFVMLKCTPIIQASEELSIVLLILGLFSALFSTFLGRIRSDIKTKLAYASMTQVSFIYIELGLHWFYFAAIHLAGHMCLRTYQFLRAPSALHDLHVRESLGINVRELVHLHDRLISRNTQNWLYRLSFEEGGLVNLYTHYLVEPFMIFCNLLSRFERQTEALIEVWVKKMSRMK